MTGRSRWITAASAPPLPSGEGRGEGAPRGFTLTELLVAVSIILVLMTLVAGAVSAARSAAKANATVAAIARLDSVVMAQFRRYASRSVDVPASLPSGMTQSNHRAWQIRRTMITGDMVDRWTDVAFMAANPTQFTSPSQRSYIATWNAAVAASKTPTDQFAGAECLFMIIMQGGFADCLDCDSLRQLKKGDKDGDGVFEFWDGWDEPIGYILWAPAFRAKGGSAYFSGARALDPDPFAAAVSIRPSLGMQPLIYSGGPDKEYGFERNGDVRTLDAGTSPVGRDCGNHLSSPCSLSGGPTSGAGSTVDDNITNLGIEVPR